MGAAVSITRLDLTASELRKAASGEKDSAAARRILALALVLDGVDRKTAAETCGMDRQTLRDWVHRYNAAGLAGLRNLKSPGPGSKLTARQQAELAELVDAGPDPAVHGVVRWRRVDLRDELQRRFGVALHERSVGKVLAKLGYRKLSVRPRHPRADEEAQETFKKNFAATVTAQIPDRAKGKPIEIWFQDEARIGQQGTLTRVWAKRGTRPRAPHDQRYDWAYLARPVRNVASQPAWSCRPRTPRPCRCISLLSAARWRQVATPLSSSTARAIILLPRSRSPKTSPLSVCHPTPELNPI